MSERDLSTGQVQEIARLRERWGDAGPLLHEATEEYDSAQGRWQAARARLYGAIKQAAAAGMSTRQIGELTNLSHQRVAQIIADRDESGWRREQDRFMKTIQRTIARANARERS